MYMCVIGIHFADVSTILLFYFGTVLTMSYFFYFSFHVVLSSKITSNVLSTNSPLDLSTNSCPVYGEYHSCT
jgi:hypothetical protein